VVQRDVGYAPEVTAEPLDSAQIALVDHSYGRCLLRPTFFAEFYERFLTSSPAVAAKFRDTEMVRQQQILRESIAHMILFAEGKAIGRVGVERAARAHSRKHLDIQPSLYELWLSALLTTVERLDVEYTPEVGRAWRAVLAPGIAFFTDHYRE